MLGVTAPEKPQVEITKSDAPFQRLRAIAKTMLSDGQVKTIEQGVSKAAKENPELYRDYRRLFDEDGRQRALQS